MRAPRSSLISLTVALRLLSGERRAAEHHVALARANVSVGRGTRRADEQIIDAVTVDIARVAYCEAREVIFADAFEDEALASIATRTGSQVVQLEGGRKTACTPEHDVALAGIVLAMGI